MFHVHWKGFCNSAFCIVDSPFTCSFCKSRFRSLQLEEPNANEINHDIHLANTLFQINVSISGAKWWVISGAKIDEELFHFPFLSSNIPSSPAYGVFISQLIRNARACSSYDCFILRTRRISSKLLKQGYLVERLKSSFRKFYGRYGDLIEQYGVTLSRMLNDILTLDQQWLPYRSDFPPTSWPLYRAWPSPNYEWFPWSICNGCG